MDKGQRQKLNILYQQLIMDRFKGQSILGGRAELIHHFKQGRTYPILWYIPMGVPVTAKQHNDIHLGNRSGQAKTRKIIREMTKIYGDKWLKDVENRKWKIIKYVNYEDVKRYFNGTLNDYI